MKVLLISNLYPSSVSPFYGSFVKNFEDQLKEDKRIELIKGIFIKGLHGGKLKKIISYLIFYIKIICITLFYNYDLIYVHFISHSTLPLRIVNSIKPLPLVFNIHGEDLLVTTPLATRLLKLALPLVKKSLWIVVPSNYFKKITLKYLPNYSSDKIIVSASGGVKNLFRPLSTPILNIPNIKIGYVSRIDRGKGWETLIKSIKILVDKGFVPETYIVGSGPQEKDLQNLIKNYKLKNIHFIGPIAHDELPYFYQSLDVFIFPTELRESLGLVGLEAMACGIPVIGSEIGGLTDYIKDGFNGYFFSPGDTKDLADKILNFSQLDINTRWFLISNSLLTAEKYRDNIVAQKLFDMIL